ncbi:MAG TPA: lamin tail domain-containing protein [Candidatus Polarisedimenticolaceae bacterium]|nr:lamin tail domain-containing protein [Candidatus Polarisedimenticolaceae bacterium]
MHRALPLALASLLVSAHTQAFDRRPTDMPPRLLRAPRSIPPSPLVLSEVLYDGGNQPQFVELVAVREIDLTGWKLQNGGDLSFTFARSDPRFPCPQPFSLRAGDRVILWQGTGTPACAGPERQIFVSPAAFLRATGDDLALFDAGGSCVDFLPFGAAPADRERFARCSWSGPRPGNDGVHGSSISRFDGAPFTDHHAGTDWERSGRSSTRGPISPGEPNEAATDADGDGVLDAHDNCVSVRNADQADADHDGIGDACRDLPARLRIPVLEQDIRSDHAAWAQQRQQPTTRVGVNNGARYRSLGWVDLSSLPPGARVLDVRLVYWTTSGNPDGLGPNGDVRNLGSPVHVELRKVLRPWNHDEPLTYPPDLGDNDTEAGSGETSWTHALYPQTWQVPGASGASDSAFVAAVGTIGGGTDRRFDLAAPALVSLVQSWLESPGSNHGFLLQASASEESGPDSRKILCGKGFPLETSTPLEEEVAISHRPEARILVQLP